MVHLVALHSVKSSNPSGLELAAKDNIPFHPYFTIKDLLGLGVNLIGFSVFVFFLPDTLIESANNIPANPLQTPAHIVPEWYFLPFYAILRSVPDLAGGVMAMALSVVIFAAMPFLDRSKIPGGSRYRPVYRAMYYLFIMNIFVLGYVGAKPVTQHTALLGQLATIVYFTVFLLLPLISMREEKYLRARGLPPELETLIKDEEAKKAEHRQKKQRRHT
jgi:quinol-cytochrome oxidoreductase complex cytochrome b subunit